MDRSSLLRQQMRQRQSSSSALSGKDKAKQLRLLKQQQRLPPASSRPSSTSSSSEQRSGRKNEEKREKSRPVKAISSEKLTSTAEALPPSRVLTAPPLPRGEREDGRGALGLTYDNSDEEDEEEEEVRGLPQGFFDADVTLRSTPQSSSMREREGENDSTVSALPPGFFDSSSSSSCLVEAPQAKKQPARSEVVEEEESSALPSGFFDDKVEDLKARGVDVQAAAAKIEKQQDSELEALLQEVDAVESSMYKAEGLTSAESLADEYDHILKQQESSETEMMNTAVQLAYEAKVASLMTKTEQLKKRKRTTNGDVDDGGEEYDSKKLETEADTVLQYIGGGADKVNGQDKDEDNGNVENSVTEVLAKKRREKKAKRLAAKSQEYVPLDIMDWTSKVI